MAGQMLQKMGVRGDTLLVHINPKEFELLKKARKGKPLERNPKTGLYQFDSEGGGEGPGAEGGGNGPGMGADGGDGGGPSGQGGQGQTEHSAEKTAAAGPETMSTNGPSETATGTPDKGFLASVRDFLGIPKDVQSVTSNPGGFLVDHAIPGMGVVNAGLSMAGVPSIGTMMGSHGVDTGNNPGSGIGDPGGGGGAGGGSMGGPGMFASPGLGGTPPAPAPGPPLIPFAGGQVNPAQIQPFNVFQPTPNPNLNLFGAQALR